MRLTSPSYPSKSRLLLSSSVVKVFCACQTLSGFLFIIGTYWNKKGLASVMSLLDKRKMYFVSQVDPDIGLWTVNVQVAESHRSQVTSGRNGVAQRIFKRFLLVDKNGTKVSGVLYENDIQYFSNSLQQFKRYRISNAKLIPAYSFFKVGDYGFSWVIKSDTPVEPIAEAIAPPIPFSYTVCPFNEFILHADKEFGFNIKGIVIHAFPRREINENTSHREFVLVDESMTPIIMTLWNTYGDVEGNIIANNIEKYPVIIGLNMKSTTSHGLSLGTRMYSYPPLADNPSLSQWYTTNKSQITELVQSKAYKQTDMLLPPPDLSKTIDVPTTFATLPTINSAWVSGRLRFTPSNQQYYLCACANCHRKADTGSDWILLCSACGAHEEVKLRCRIPVQLEGGDKFMQVVLTSPDVERLTGLTPESMRDSHQYDLNVNDDLLLALDKLHVVCFVKKYDPKTMGTTRTPGLRFSVVKTYALDSINKESTTQPAVSNKMNHEASTANTTISSPRTKGKVTDLEDITKSHDAEQSNKTMKHNLEAMETTKGHNDHDMEKQKTLSGEARPMKRNKNK